MIPSRAATLTTDIKIMTRTFPINAGGLTVRHTEDQLLSLTARFICDGKPGTGFIMPGVALVTKNDHGQLCMGRVKTDANGEFDLAASAMAMSKLFNETSDTIVARLVRWASEAS